MGEYLLMISTVCLAGRMDGGPTGRVSADIGADGNIESTFINYRMGAIYIMGAWSENICGLGAIDRMGDNIEEKLKL